MTNTPQPNVYGNLLKFKKGIEAGLKPQEIAKELYGGFKEKDILEKLQQLKLITQYLKGRTLR